MNRRGVATATAVLSLLALATACGDDESGDSGGSTETETIEISVSNGTVTPGGDRIDVDVDQPVDLVVTSDEAGEIHVHSSPEQSFEFDAGNNAPIELSFDRPGLVEIELHEPVEAPLVELRVE